MSTGEMSAKTVIAPSRDIEEEEERNLGNKVSAKLIEHCWNKMNLLDLDYGLGLPFCT